MGMTDEDYEAQLAGSKDHAKSAERWLEDNGLSSEWAVRVARPNELMVDLDQPGSELLNITFEGAWPRLKDALERLGNRANVMGFELESSKSGGMHVVVTMQDPMPLEERVAWQLIFGSDPTREALVLERHHAGEENTILLYTRKYDRPGTKTSYSGPLLLNEVNQ